MRAGGFYFQFRQDKHYEAGTKPHASVAEPIPTYKIFETQPVLADILQHAPREIQKRIATGHARRKHLETGEFRDLGVREVDHFMALISDVMKEPTHWKKLDDGRVAFWDNKTRTLVVYDPNLSDLGTAFRPSNGKYHFDKLK